MISDNTKKLLSAAAKKNNLGGDTRVLKEYNDNEIEILFNIFINNEDKFTSLFDKNNIHKNFSLFKFDISRHMMTGCKEKLMFKIFKYLYPETSLCIYCANDKKIEDLKPDNSGFKRYCKNCLSSNSHKKHIAESIDDQTRSEKGKKISQKKKDFYKSEYGKSVAKRIGSKNSEKLKDFYKTERGIEVMKSTAIKTSEAIKEKIFKNEFTPNIHNSKTHWQCEYNGKKYRSSWEAMWHSIYPDLLYETVRIVYYYNDKSRIYIVDFEDKTNKILYEIKPISQRNNDKIVAKETCAKEWCLTKGYTYVTITENELIEHRDIILNSDLPENIKEKFIKLCNSQN